MKIQSFEIFNESLRDKMVSKELSADAEYYMNYINKFESIVGVDVEGPESKDNNYSSMFIIQDNSRDAKYITIEYNTISKLWSVEIYHAFAKMSQNIDEDKDGDSIILKILNTLYPTIDKNIEHTKKEIERKREILKRLHKIKEVQNDYKI